jgi:hypothetical protein
MSSFIYGQNFGTDGFIRRKKTLRMPHSTATKSAQWQLKIVRFLRDEAVGIDHNHAGSSQR